MPAFREAVYRAASEEQTIAAGEQIARGILADDSAPSVVLIFLTGDLGAGKTTITKGFARAVSSADEQEVSSPTFTLIHEYGPYLIHVDLYRLDTDQEFRTLGLEDYFDDSRVSPGNRAIVLIEWAEKFRHLLPPPAYEIRLTHEGEGRRITVRHG